MSVQTALLVACSLILLLAVAIGTLGPSRLPGEQGMGRIGAALR